LQSRLDRSVSISVVEATTTTTRTTTTTTTPTTTTTTAAETTAPFTTERYYGSFTSVSDAYNSTSTSVGPSAGVTCGTVCVVAAAAVVVVVLIATVVALVLCVCWRKRRSRPQQRPNPIPPPAYFEASTLELQRRANPTATASASPNHVVPVSAVPPSLALSATIHCKRIRISADILWRVFRILTEPVPYTLVSVNRRGPALRYSVDLRIQTYTKTVTLK